MNIKKLAFTLQDSSNIVIDFNSQKQVPTWSGVYTILRYNLLERGAKVASIIDVLVRFTNLKSTVISKQIHLDAMRVGMYEDMAKVTFNEISHKTKAMFPLLAKRRKELSNIELSDMNLSKDNLTLFIAKVADIINSFLEAQVEKRLGSQEYDILYAIEKAYVRIEEARSKCEDQKLAKKIVKAAHHLMTAKSDDCQFVSIIDFTARQSQVKRWAGRATLNNFNLLEHAARVACSVDVFLQVNSKELNFSTEEELQTLRYALYHDYPEVLLNDTPSPVKAKYPDLDVLLKEIEGEIMELLDLTETKNIKFICKIVDIKDCLYEAKQEKLLGNQDPEFDLVINGYAATFAKQVAKFAGVDQSIVDKLKEMFI